MGCEHELLAEPEHVERHRAVVAIEGAQGLDLLRLRDQLVTESDLRFDVFGGVPVPVPTISSTSSSVTSDAA